MSTHIKLREVFFFPASNPEFNSIEDTFEISSYSVSDSWSKKDEFY